MAEELLWADDPVASDEPIWEDDPVEPKAENIPLEKTPTVVDPNDPFTNKEVLDPTNEVQTEAEGTLSTLQGGTGQTLRGALAGDEPTQSEQEWQDSRVSTAETAVIAEQNQKNKDIEQNNSRIHSNTLIANAEQDVAKLENVYKNIATGGLTRSNRDEIRTINRKIVDIMYGQGHTSVKMEPNGTITWENPETGEREPLRGGVFKDLMSAKFEAGAAILGASGASRIPIPNPYAKGAAVIAGGVVGAMTGKAADMYANTLDFNLDMAELPWLEQVATAGVTDAVFGLGGVALAKTIGGGFKFIKEALRNKEVDKAMAHLETINPDFKLLDDGSPTEAMKDTTEKYLKSYGMTDETIGEMTPDQYKRAVIEAVVTTDPKYSTIVKELASDDTLAVRISNQVKERAEVVKKQLSHKKEVTTGQNVVDNIVEADTEAKGLYHKAQGTIIKAFDGTEISSKAGGMIQGGTREFIQTIMSDPTLSATLTKGKLGRLFSSITKLGGDVKDMNGVLNLRDSVAELAKKAKLEGRGKQYIDDYLKALDDTTDAIIDNNSFLSSSEKSGMKTGLSKGREFAETSAETLKTSLFKAIESGKGKNHDNIMDSFLKYASSDDGMFEKVAGTLTTAERNLLENSMLKRATAKHLKSENINYQALADTLEGIAPRLQSESGTQGLALARGMAEMFQNDTMLSKLTSEFRRGSKGGKVDDIFSNTGSGMGKTLGGKYQTAKATAYWKALLSTANGVADTIFDIALKTPVVGKIVKGSQRGKDVIANQQREAIYSVMEKQLLKEKPDFIGLTKDLAQLENLPPKLAAGLKDFVRAYSKIQDNINPSNLTSEGGDIGKGIPNEKVGNADQLPNPEATTMTESEAKAQGRREFREGVDGTPEKLPTPDPKEIYKRDVVRKWYGTVKNDVEDPETLKALIGNVEKNMGTDKQEAALARLKQYAAEEGIELPEQMVVGNLKPKGTDEIGMDVVEPTQSKMEFSTEDGIQTTNETAQSTVVNNKDVRSDAQVKAKSLLDKALAEGKSVPEATEIYERSIGRSAFDKKQSDKYTRWMRKNPTKVFHHYAKEHDLDMDTIEAYYKAKGGEVPSILKGE